MKLGIITLHRILNYGSALQAYALQRYLSSKEGLDVELIDYIYPNKEYKQQQGFVKYCKGCVRIALEYLFKSRKQKLASFSKFYNNYYILSHNSYDTVQEIHKNPPIYDVYVTGSDQVWNVETLRNNPVMYCTFAPKNAKVVSFGASFTLKQLPKGTSEIIKKRLGRYSCIGVREQSSLKILENLNLNHSINKMCTCDPTLLLTAQDYALLSQTSSLKIVDKYILVYALGYAYNPDPILSNLLDKLTREFDYQIIYIGDYKLKRKFPKVRVIYGLGPCEFIYLVEHAIFVLTSSFHGTMFSLIFRKPFLSILPEKSINDCRIKDVLKLLNLENNCVESDGEIPALNFSNPFTNEVESNLKNYIKESQDFIQTFYSR